MRPVVASMWTGTPRREWKYAELALVWEYSARKVFGDRAEIICRAVGDLDLSQPCPTFSRKGTRTIGPSKSLAWREKIRAWAAIMEEVGPGRAILLTDIDVAFFSNPFGQVRREFEGVWDVGLCAQSTGAVYFRGTERSHEFMRRWLAETERLFDDAELYEEMDRKYMGLDQSSIQLVFGYKCPGRVVNLPLRYHSTVNNYELPAHLMHYHSIMRGAIYGATPLSEIPRELRPYVTAWKRMREHARSEK
jgi:hypothetical protein